MNMVLLSLAIKILKSAGYMVNNAGGLFIVVAISDCLAAFLLITLLLSP